MSDWNIKIEGLEELKARLAQSGDYISEELNKTMLESVLGIQSTARSYAPHRTGNLQRSILEDIKNNGLQGIVYVDNVSAPYGIFMEMGTGPHDIYPINKQALFWAGADHPVRHVFHPGTAPRPFMQPAFEQNYDKVVNLFRDMLTRVTEKLAG
jgi:HK97 gp10 family phage protein